MSSDADSGHTSAAGSSGVSRDDASAPARDDASAPARHARSEGRYERRWVLGQGGMGRVLMVFDRRLGRDVAVKEVAADEAEFALRLRREAAIIAELEHPGIVPIYDVDDTTEGGLFFAMRLVRGRSLADALRAARGFEARSRFLRHVLDACQAVAYAHHRGIIHRDLKPGNIMVGEFGETQVIDWGLARRVGDAPDDRAQAASGDDRGHAGSGAAADSDLTVAGGIIGTPRYMSPEQARGERASQRSDVFALGAVLYDLCSGRAPFEGRARSDVLADARRGDVPAVRTREPLVPPELAAIVQRALAADPDARYPDARALATDLAAFLDGRRVLAYAYRPTDLLRRFMRVWRVPLIVAALALVCIAVAIAVAFGETQRERDRAVAAERAVRGALADSDRHLADALVLAARDDLRRGATPEAERLAARALTLADGSDPEARGLLMTLAGAGARPRLLASYPLGCRAVGLAPDGASAICRGPGDVSTWRLGGALLWSRAVQGRSADVAGGSVLIGASPTARVLGLADGEVTAALALTCEGVVEAAADADAGLFWNAACLQLLRHGELGPVARPCGEASIAATALSRDGSSLAVLCASGVLLVGPAPEALGALATLGDAVEPVSLAFLAGPAPGFAIGTSKGQLLVVGAVDGARRARFDDVGAGLVTTLAAAPDGHFVALTGEGGGTTIVDLTSGARTRLPIKAGVPLRFLAGRPVRLATASDAVRIWEVPALAPGSWDDLGGVAAMAASPTGALAIGQTHGITVLDPAGASPPLHLGPLAHTTKGLSFSADGGELDAVLAGDDRVRRWRTPDWGERADWPTDSARRIVHLAGDALVAYYARVGVALAPSDDHGPLAIVPGEAVLDLQSAPGDAFAAALLERGHALVCIDARPVPHAYPCAVDPDATAVARSADGEEIYAARRGSVAAYASASGDLLHWYASAPEAELLYVLAGPRAFLVAGARDGSVWIWRAPTAELVAVLRDHRERMVAAAFDAGEHWIATGGWDGRVVLHDLSVLDLGAAEIEREVEARTGLALDDALLGATR